MKLVFSVVTAGALCSACTTLDQSVRLGVATGALAGAAATYAAESSEGRTPRMENVGAAAAVGLGAGLLISYFVHQSVIDEREATARQTEIYFGDLPPSPFVIPNPMMRRGGKR